MSNKANNTLEEQFKSLLNDHELPYDPAAWTKMSSKLDAALPVSGKSKWPWYIGIASSVILITGAVIFVNSRNNDSINTVQLSQSSTTQSTDKSNQQSETALAKNQQTKVNAAAEQGNQIEPIYPEIPHIFEVLVESDEPSIETIVDVSIVDHELKVTEKILGIPDFSSDKWEFLAIQSICLGESRMIKNSNSSAVYVRDASGNDVFIPANSSKEFIAVREGKHDVVEIATGTTKESFMVQSAPQLTLQLDHQYIYESGLPTTLLSVNANAEDLSWYVNGKSVNERGNQFKGNFYHKGAYNISVKGTASNGCTSEASRRIFIDEAYNLLAVNAFDPNSSDNRKNAFIPYALTVRSVDFEMIVIDPTDGAIIFESREASNPWRGQDKRTGQMVEPNKTYIWRVVLSNPQPGEHAEYKGTIVRL
jgi:hypothetical protein